MLHSAHHMYRYVARRSAAASSSLASVARPCLRLPHSSSSPLPRLSMLHAAAASAALHPSQPPSQHARGLTTSSTPTPNAAHKAHAASAESASEFLDDPALLRDQAYVNGKWVGSATSTNTYEVKDPATHVVIAKVPSMGAADTRAAIDAAAAAWDGWRHKTGKERGDVLRRWHDLMQLHMTDLAKILTLENGKPLAESRGEIGYAASFVEFYAEEAKRTYGEVIPSPTPGRRLVTIKQPVGVAALISPWNFPSAMITRKAAPALAAGCPVVIKPAEDTPLSALALAELAERAGVPPGVLNVITCPREHAAEVGLELSTNKDVRKVSFTGSTAVGKILMRDCASTVKKLSLELGGNAPLLVFDDADLENALNGVLAAKFRNAGQTCVSPNRLLVQAGVYDEFVRRLAERVSELQVGHGLQPGVQVSFNFPAYFYFYFIEKGWVYDEFVRRLERVSELQVGHGLQPGVQVRLRVVWIYVLLISPFMYCSWRFFFVWLVGKGETLQDAPQSLTTILSLLPSFPPSSRSVLSSTPAGSKKCNITSRTLSKKALSYSRGGRSMLWEGRFSSLLS